jgi:hypothetical protein
MISKFRPTLKPIGQRFPTSFDAFFTSIRGLCNLSSPARNRLKYSLNSALLVVFALLHTADGFVTYFGLKFTSVDEANPVLVFVAGIMGLGLSIFLLKLACLSVIAMLFSARRNLGNCWSTATLFSADAFYSWVVGNNLFLVAVA